jgi:hypothetical protein
MLPVNVYYCECRNLAVTGTHALDIRPSSCHGRFQLDGQPPVIQIHKAAIFVERPTLIHIEVLSRRNVDVLCDDCGCKLLLHASRKGAFCQITRPLPTPVYGSLPNRVLSVPDYSHQLPLSVRPLFRQSETDLFPDNRTESPIEILMTPPDYRDRTDEATDDDLMFGSSRGPFVGSYSALGRFATDEDYMVFV